MYGLTNQSDPFDNENFEMRFRTWDKDLNANWYQGYFDTQGNKHGPGVSVVPSGGIFMFNYHNGSREGSGAYILSDGGLRNGHFVNDKMHG